MLFSKAKDKNFWKQVSTNVYYNSFLEEAKWLYDNYCQCEIAVLKHSDYMIYFNTGSREEYQKKYFSRLARIDALTILSLVYGGKYITELEDVICAICEQYSWALPAHVNITDVNDRDSIDLFAAEIGFALSEILYLLEDKLSLLVKEQIKGEISKRIIEPFINREFWWEKANTNWAAVCAGSVGSTFMYIAPDKLSQVQHRIDSAMESFLSGFLEDGVCQEGIGYWDYGFGNFVYYADLLREFTNGKKDYFKLEKVKKIAAFQQKAYMQGDVVVSYSDSFMNYNYNVGLTHYLKKEYPTDVQVMPFEYRGDYTKNTGNNCFRYSSFMRNIVWANENINYGSAENFYFLEDSQWYINSKSTYAFSVKGGNNDEPHNHNDIGNFIITSNNKQLICDVGCGEYVKGYFDPATRYDFICNSSLGHNVPIIDNKGQSAGKEYCGEIISANEHGVKLEISNSYPKNIVSKLIREFSLTENSINLIDTFEFDNDSTPVIERFVSIIEPIIHDEYVKIDNLKILYNSAVCKPKINCVQYSDHKAINATLYCVDFMIIKTNQNINVSFTFDIDR